LPLGGEEHESFKGGKMKISRRSFVKFLGLGGAALAAPSVLYKSRSSLPDESLTNNMSDRGNTRAIAAVDYDPYISYGRAYLGYNWRGLSASAPDLARKLGEFSGVRWFSVIRPLHNGTVSIPLGAAYSAEAVYDSHLGAWRKQRFNREYVVESPTPAVFEVINGRPVLTV
jgi:hypothetical protein